MAEILPIKLVGDDLGKRQHCLNSLVNKVYEQNVPLQSVLEKPEKITIDRIFKIDLASKHRNLDFIIENLKDKDMLFVSRALKCKWLLDTEYSHIINPVYLETQLYPSMVTPAVNKMKHFIQLNLKDPKRCEQFYEYYKNDFDVCIKFLWHCSKDFIKEQVLNVIDRLSPKHLRILCEACPQVAEVYFKGLKDNKAALRRYLRNETSYHDSIKNILKVEADIYLDIIEKYSNRNVLNSSLTRFIMKNHKERYLAKPELYAGRLLNIKTLALFLSKDEAKDIVIILMRAKFLQHTFTYKELEPFIKRLDGEERAAFKKKIFVDKSFGDMIEKWPYSPPEQLVICESDSEPLKDTQHLPYEYEDLDSETTEMLRPEMMLKRRKFCKYLCAEDMMLCSASLKRNVKSNLDTLFDRYRFENFDRVFFEFRKLLMAEGTIEGRRNMMLVLVSKAGGNEAKVQQLLKFLVERHANEPDHLRDAVARSIVKRTFGWRLSQETWEILLQWATTSVREILHAKILRHLLADTVCPPTDLKSYLDDFSDMTEYSLNAEEKSLVKERLPKLLVSANAPNLFLDVITSYKLRLEDVPKAKDMLITAARRDEHILRRVFGLRVARRYLFQESFKIIQTDAAYVNALKHDVSVLKNGDKFVTLLSNEKTNHNRFLRLLVLYFSEPDGLAFRHLNALKKAINEECKLSFARPLAFLSNVSNESLHDYLGKINFKSTEVTEKVFVAAVKANAGVIRPPIDVDVENWHSIGAKVISNKILLCSNVDVHKYIQKALQWKRTMRAAFLLAKRNNSVSEVLATVCKARPTLSVKLFLSDLQKGVVDIHIWNLIKPIILSLDLNKKPLTHVLESLENCNFHNDKHDTYEKGFIQADYWTCVFEAFRKVSEQKAMPMLCNIENLLTAVDKNASKEIVTNFVREKFNKDLMLKNFPKICVSLYFRIIAKYLLISKTSDEQKTKIETVCDPFFDELELIWNELDNKSEVITCLNDFLESLKYTEAFLSTKYVCCLPVFERILERLPKVFPREKHFQTYAYIHITMLYYRSIRQVIKQRPEIFENPKLTQDQGIKAIGFTLGKYIGIEIQDLVKNYFKSIVNIYRKALLNFLQSFEYNESRKRFSTALVQGLIESKGDSLLLAQYVYDKTSCYESEEILKLLKNADNDEMKFFLYARINPY